MNEFLLIAFLLVSVEVKGTQVGLRTLPSFYPPPLKNHKNRYPRTENERLGTIISTGSGQKQMCVVAAASDAIPAYPCPAPPAAPADSSPHAGDLLTLNSHMKQYSTKLAGFPQRTKTTFWCSRDSRNEEKVLFGVCGIPATRKNCFLVLAGFPQQGKTAFWCLRELCIESLSV